MVEAGETLAGTNAQTTGYQSRTHLREPPAGTVEHRSRHRVGCEETPRETADRGQCPCDSSCIRRPRSDKRGIAFLELDGFLVLHERSLGGPLPELERHPAVVVNWRMYGPNGHEARVEGLQQLLCTREQTGKFARVLRFQVMPVPVLPGIRTVGSGSGIDERWAYWRHGGSGADGARHVRRILLMAESPSAGDHA